MTLVKRQDHPIQRNQASKAPTSPPSNRSDNENYKDSLELNNIRLFEASFRFYKAFIELEISVKLEAPAKSPYAFFLSIC